MPLHPLMKKKNLRRVSRRVEAAKLEEPEAARDRAWVGGVFSCYKEPLSCVLGTCCAPCVFCYIGSDLYDSCCTFAAHTCRSLLCTLTCPIVCAAALVFPRYCGPEVSPRKRFCCYK